MLKPALVALAALLFLPAGRATAASTLRLEPLWTATGLADPESVALSADKGFFYVSNVKGEADAKDGDGFIAKVSTDGRILQLRWASGLDAPKGLILKGASLFAADIDQLVEIDADSGRILARYPAPGAKFLNDTAVAPDGAVLVSDSATQRIYALKDGRMRVWAEAPLLRAINGLYVEPERLVIVTMDGLLLAMDWKTQTITVLAKGLGDGDGIAAIGGGAYLASEWPGRVYEIGPDGTVRTLVDSRSSETYANDLLVVGDRLYLPNMKPGTLTAYRIVR